MRGVAVQVAVLLGVAVDVAVGFEDSPPWTSLSSEAAFPLSRLGEAGADLGAARGGVAATVEKDQKGEREWDRGNVRRGNGTVLAFARAGSTRSTCRTGLSGFGADTILAAQSAPTGVAWATGAHLRGRIVVLPERNKLVRSELKRPNSSPPSGL